MSPPWIAPGEESEPNGDLTPAELEAYNSDTRKTAAFYWALRDLKNESVSFLKNFNVYCKWNRDTRLWWIARIEADAQAGKETVGASVVTRVVINRLKGQHG